MSSQRYKRPKENIIVSAPDKTIIIVVSFLVVIGLMAVFSAGAPKSVMQGEDPGSFVLKQSIWLVLGIIGAKFFANYDYKNLKFITLIFTWIVVALLAAVHFTDLGQTVNEARRWLVIGPIQFQPSELAKPAVVLLLATAFEKNAYFWDVSKLQYYIPILIMVGFTFKQPNLSMVILLLATSLMLYISAGGKLKGLIMGMGACGFAVVPFVYDKIMKPYQLTRIKIWLNPEADEHGAGYNIIQSLVAFSAGGFAGVGFGNSKQKLAWLPEGHTDFIFSVIAEEFGFIGCVLIIGLFWMLVYRGFTIASRCHDMFGKLLAVGITFSIGIQAFINISVASSFFPATGITLPFISYGGSSLMVSLCMIGILLNISKKRVRRIWEDVVPEKQYR